MASDTRRPAPLLKLASPRWSRPTSSTWVWTSISQNSQDSTELHAQCPSARGGQWTTIEHLPDGTMSITTDAARSRHLLFAWDSQRWLIADEPALLPPLLPRWKRDEEAARTFLHTGFVPGTRTLAEGVQATPAGSVTLLHPDGTWKSTLWRDYRFSSSPVRDGNEFEALFDTALDAVFSRLLRRTGDRQLLIPLSGGLDSRLLAVWLLRLGAPRVTAFTYGKPGSPEVVVSSQVAKSLGIEWFSIDLDPSDMAKRWRSPKAAEFRTLTHGLTSLPHVQDWYALTVMQERHLIDDDAVFLPGHTIVGNMHDEELARCPINWPQLRTTLRVHHANLQPSAPRSELMLLEEEILTAETELFPEGHPDDPRAVQQFFEWFNLRERQAKYINNSMRGYEAFGYDWALPMLDVEMWDCWLKGAPQLTLTREWYGEYVQQHYRDATGAELPLHTVGVTGIPEGLRRMVITTLRATHADALLARYRSTRTMLSHPMCFEAFNATVPAARQMLTYARGGNNLGLWADHLLDGTWKCSENSLPLS